MNTEVETEKRKLQRPNCCLLLWTASLLLPSGLLRAQPTVDEFNPGADGVPYPSVYSLAVQAAGKILVGGGFMTLGGKSRSRIGRLNPDGSLDTGFNPWANNTVFSLAGQADGKILVGGGSPRWAASRAIGLADSTTRAPPPTR